MSESLETHLDGGVFCLFDERFFEVRTISRGTERKFPPTQQIKHKMLKCFPSRKKASQLMKCLRAMTFLITLKIVDNLHFLS